MKKRGLNTEMINVRVVTSNNRGFLKDLFDNCWTDIVFHYGARSIYEKVSKKRVILSRLITLKVFDYLGVFQVIKVRGTEDDIYFSYNRFVASDKPYIIYLENPGALVNYCWNRPKYFLTRKRIHRLMSNRKLRGIICMSKICENTLGNLYQLPDSLKIMQIYPLVSEDKDYGLGEIKTCVYQRIVECLFISARFRWKGGKDIIEVFKVLDATEASVHLTIITRFEDMIPEDMEQIQLLRNVTLRDFNLNKEELSEYYKRACLLLHPTRWDSSPLTILEAIKYGCAVLGTDVYAIREMVKNGYNGYLIQPQDKYWSDDGNTDKERSSEVKRRADRGVIDTELVLWMKQKILELVQDRGRLEELCCNAYRYARESEFSESYITEKWDRVLREAVGEK